MEKESSSDEESGDGSNDDKPEPPNNGKMVLDATCAPADIRYPSDLSLLNEAREDTEGMLNELWETHKKTGRKTRYSRKKARSGYLSIAKQKTKRVTYESGEAQADKVH